MVVPKSTAGQRLASTRTIQASTSLVYTAFTSPDWLKRWFCDNTNIRPQVNGHVLFVWNTGFHATGVYTTLVSNQQIAFTWRATLSRIVDVGLLLGTSGRISPWFVQEDTQVVQ